MSAQIDAPATYWGCTVHREVRYAGPTRPFLCPAMEEHVGCDNPGCPVFSVWTLCDDDRGQSACGLCGQPLKRISGQCGLVLLEHDPSGCLVP